MKQTKPNLGWPKATTKSLKLDRPTSHGGWPEGEYVPSVHDRIRDYLRSMMLLGEAAEQAAPPTERVNFVSHQFEPSNGDLVVNNNESCKHYKSLGFVTSVKPMEGDAGNLVCYCCINSGPSWSVGEVLTKTMDQLRPYGE